jgi:hypothetical protein
MGKKRTWISRLRLAVRVLAIAALALFFTSNQAKALKLLAPTRFGMESIGRNIYVDKEMPSGQREEVLRLVAESERRIGRFYGGATSAPKLIFCSTEGSFQAFGGTQQRGLTLGKYASLFSPRGLTEPIVTHEWSHAELYLRLGGFRHWRRVPQWFDDGLAVTVSEEPSHSEEVYQQARKEGIPIPGLSELISLRQWNAAAKKFGRPEQNPHHLHVVYATAGHEVRSWFREANTSGLQRFLARMRSGEDFAAAYSAARRGGITSGPPPKSDSP